VLPFVSLSFQFAGHLSRVFQCDRRGAMGVLVGAQCYRLGDTDVLVGPPCSWQSESAGRRAAADDDNTLGRPSRLGDRPAWQGRRGSVASMLSSSTTACIFHRDIFIIVVVVVAWSLSLLLWLLFYVEFCRCCRCVQNLWICSVQK